MLDQCLSTGERTGQAAEVFFIHTLAKKKSLLISLHYPPPLALVQVIRMTISFTHTQTQSDSNTHAHIIQVSQVHGDMTIHSTSQHICP